jgi:hypothetical protein
MDKKHSKEESHSAYVWWTMRIVEMITCGHIIAGVWRHW